MNKHAFVTGATGFLGVNLIPLLMAEGWQITAIHRSQVTHPVLKDQPINWVNTGLDNVAGLRKALPSEPFTVFHMAASTTQWKKNYQHQNDTNVTGTANLIEAVQGSPIERFIYTSSISAFGLQDGVITEKTPSQAVESGHNYSITKWQAEQLIKEECKQKKLDAVILNPCHIVGPWDTNNWIQLFTHVRNETIPGIPPASGNFAWVGEVAKAHIMAAINGKCGENYILGGPFVSILSFINEMEKQLNKKVSTKTISPILLKAIEPFYRLKGFLTNQEPTLTPDKVKLLLKSFEADDSKARSELGYQHKSIAEIVRRTLAWMDSNE